MRRTQRCSTADSLPDGVLLVVQLARPLLSGGGSVLLLHRALGSTHYRPSVFRRAPDPAHSGACPTCGRPLDTHDRHVRFALPDPLLAAPQAVRDEMWQTKTMIQAEGYGAFVRALLPVRLTGGWTVTFGLWLGVDPKDMRRAFAEWHATTYPDLVLDGVLANAIKPWNLLAVPARAVVKNPQHPPLH